MRGFLYLHACFQAQGAIALGIIVTPFIRLPDLSKARRDL